MVRNYLAHDFDIAIWHGAGQWRGFHAEQLTEDEIFPVCSPSLLRNGPPLRVPKDLANFTIIRNSTAGTGGDEWSFWLDAAEASNVEFRSEISCDFMITALQAGIDGMGIALGRSTVVERDLAEGRLVAPLTARVKSAFNYYIVVPKGGAERLKTRCFRDWLLQTMGLPNGA